MKPSINYEIIDEKKWDQCINSFENAHFLQSKLWAEIKIENGWKASYLIWNAKDDDILAGAMILEKTLFLFKSIPIKIQYSPKGPLLRTSDDQEIENILEDIKKFSISRKAIFIKIDPDLITEVQSENQNEYKFLPIKPEFPKLLKNGNWIISNEQIQFRNTIVISLRKPDEEIMMEMKQKTRYNIRLSERKNVKFRIGNELDFEILFKLYAETALRDNFVIRSKKYYLNLWNKFYEAGMCEPLIAEYEGEILAAVIIFYFSNKAYYVYGMSSTVNRNLMATYLVQWKAIQRAKEKGCEFYDFWGAPDELKETDRMWGVYKFKLGFGGAFIRTIGAWDYVNNKFLYFLYNLVLPKVLNIMRKIGFQKTQEEID